MYLSTNGQTYGGDRQRRSDGTLDPEIPSRPSPKHQWNGTAWVIPKSHLNWAEFVAEFFKIGNIVYDGWFAKVDDADRSRNSQPITLTSLLGLPNLTPTQEKTAACARVRDQWVNLKMLLLSPELRSTENLAIMSQRVAALLRTAEKPLSASDIANWNALIDKWGFPPSCKL